MTRSEKDFIDAHRRYLTENERLYYKNMLPVWCEDIKRVMCPEELVSVIKYRISLNEEKETKSQKKPRRR